MGRGGNFWPGKRVPKMALERGVIRGAGGCGSKL